MRKATWNPRPAVEHHADALFVVLDKVGEAAFAGELHGAVFQVLLHRGVSAEDDLSHAPKRRVGRLSVESLFYLGSFRHLVPFAPILSPPD